MKDPRIFRLALWCVYALAINFLVLHYPSNFFPTPDAKPVTNVQMSLKRQGLDASVVQLPDDWYQSGYQHAERWYHTTLHLDKTKSQTWAVYLPSVTHNAAVYINNVWVGQGGHFESPVSRHHNEPLLFEFASDLLHADKTNKIEIRVKASYVGQGLMDQFYIAPMSSLKAAYNFKHFVRFDFIRWVTFAMYGMGAVVLVFWLSRKQDVIYGLFSLQLFIWATHNLNLFVSDIPVSARFWEAMTMSTLGWTVVAMLFFNHRYVGGGSKSVERMAVVFGILGLGIFLLPTVGDILVVGYRLWDSFLLVFGLYAICHLLRVYWTTLNDDVFSMLLAGVPILVFGLHDILTVNHFRDRTEGLIIQYSVIPAIILFSWFLIRRFVHSLNQAEQLAATLEQRVQNRERELHVQFQKLKALEQAQLLAQERERMMRDMHDGIGGQLLAIVTQLQSHQGELFDSLRERVQGSLADLRMVIDSLDPVLNDIPTLLGMMRPRLSSQLEAANIKLDWQISDLPELPDLSPQRSLHIMRIVQEAVANVIKHSNSDRVVIATSIGGESDQSLCIDIIDFGIGFDNLNEKNKGRGIRNMVHRAELIGAKLMFMPKNERNSNEQGVMLRIQLEWHQRRD